MKYIGKIHFFYLTFNFLFHCPPPLVASSVPNVRHRVFRFVEAKSKPPACIFSICYHHFTLLINSIRSFCSFIRYPELIVLYSVCFFICYSFYFMFLQAGGLPLASTKRKTLCRTLAAHFQHTTLN